MTARLILSRAGNKYAAAEDKTFTVLFRYRLLPAYIFVLILPVMQRGHTLAASLHYIKAASAGFLKADTIFFKLEQLNVTFFQCNKQ